MNQKQKFIIGFIIIITISLVLVLTVGNVFYTGARLNENASNLVGSIIIALIAIVSMIVGANNESN